METIIIKGAPGSPYTRKILSICRYRNIPYKFVIGGLFGKGIMNTDHLPVSKVELLPTVYFYNTSGDLEPMVDSTFILRRLENIQVNRSVIPNNPLTKFLNYLLEDYADEWLTKATFHYRLTYPKDIEKAGATLSRWRSLTDNEEEIQKIKKQITDRQVSRLYVVGSSLDNKNIIEDSYVRFLKLISNHMNTSPYMFGKRPSSSDFSIFGQLTQLALFDPTSMEIANKIASRVVAWVGIMEDLSGMEVKDNDWIQDNKISNTLKNIFCEIGRVYIPVLMANAETINSNYTEVNTIIDGEKWIQKPFQYQLKCFNWLKEEYGKLNRSDKEKTDVFLEGTGCEVMFSNS